MTSSTTLWPASQTTSSKPMQPRPSPQASCRTLAEWTPQRLASCWRSATSELPILLRSSACMRRQMRARCKVQGACKLAAATPSPPEVLQDAGRVDPMEAGFLREECNVRASCHSAQLHGRVFVSVSQDAQEQAAAHMALPWDPCKTLGELHHAVSLLGKCHL